MPHNATFHQGMHCLQRQNRSSEEVTNTTFLRVLMITAKGSNNVTEWGLLCLSYKDLETEHCL